MKKHRLREEVNLFNQALQQVVFLGDLYGVLIRKPERWTWKKQSNGLTLLSCVCRVINGAVTSLGRVPIVLDIFAEYVTSRGTFTESEIQEFVVMISMWNFVVIIARTKAYMTMYTQVTQPLSQLLWLMGNDGRHCVT